MFISNGLINILASLNPPVIVSQTPSKKSDMKIKLQQGSY